MTGNDFAEKIVNLDGSSDFVKIKEIPQNLYIVKENIYWYQYTDKAADDKKLVTKEITTTILRDDIRSILSQVKH